LSWFRREPDCRSLSIEYNMLFGISGRTVLQREPEALECGMAVGIFAFWYLTFSHLSRAEQVASISTVSGDCRFCLAVVYRRLILEKAIPNPVSSPDLLDDHFDRCTNDNTHFLYCANVLSCMLAESYLSTLGTLPTPSVKWEKMPVTARMDKRLVWVFANNFVTLLIDDKYDEKVAEVLFSKRVIRLTDAAFETYGKTFSLSLGKGFAKSGCNHISSAPGSASRYLSHCWNCSGTIDSLAPSPPRCSQCGWYRCPSCSSCSDRCG
jgi:hypothetical protein